VPAANYFDCDVLQLDTLLVFDDPEYAIEAHRLFSASPDAIEGVHG
jgi:hypothetical protein